MVVLSQEDIEYALEGKPDINRVDHIKRLQYLAKKAEPGNHWWKLLVMEYNFQPDYVNGQDEGEREY
jgi:hypothetical protein